jgi:hypothetical protein
MTKSNEMRSDTSSPLSAPRAGTRAETDTIYCLFSLDRIWYIGNISLDRWQAHTLCDDCCSDDISHGNTGKSTEKIIPLHQWDFLYA